MFSYGFPKKTGEIPCSMGLVRASFSVASLGAEISASSSVSAVSAPALSGSASAPLARMQQTVKKAHQRTIIYKSLFSRVKSYLLVVIRVLGGYPNLIGV